MSLTNSRNTRPKTLQIPSIQSKLEEILSKQPSRTSFTQSKTPLLSTNASKGRSYSMADDDLQNLNSARDISYINSEFSLKVSDGATESELKFLRAEVINLKSQIAELKKQQDSQVFSAKKKLESEKKIEVEAITKGYIEKISELEDNFNNELQKRLEIESEKLRKTLELQYRQRIQRVETAKADEIDFFQEQMQNRVVFKEQPISGHKRHLSMNTYEENMWYKDKIDEKSLEYQRKFQQKQQEFNECIRENDALKKKIADLQSKIDTFAISGNDIEFESSYIKLLNKRYTELLNSFNLLKAEQDKAANTPQYCIKCQSFMNSCSEVTRKMLRLKEFLSN